MNNKSIFMTISLALALVISVTGCKKVTPEVLPAKLSLLTETVQVTPEGGLSSIEYSIENPVEGEWVSAQPDAAWVSEFDYKEAGKIAFKVEANPAFETRELNVTVTYADAQPCSFKVVQAATAKPVLTLKSTSVEVDPEGGDAFVEYELLDPVPDVNVKAVSSADWVTDFNYEAAGKIAFKVAENGLAEPREAVVEVTYPENEPLSFKVLQAKGTPAKLAIKVKDVTFNMILVKAGSFQMGATPEQGTPETDDVTKSETPVHKVNISDFYIGECEVTQELWVAVTGKNPSYHQGEANLPVENVNWADVQEFITQLNEISGMTFMLPTEAQWEYAARGGNQSKGYKYSGSDNINEIGWYTGNSGDYSHPVAQKKANEIGIYDMCGNVYEWCNDWWYPYTEAEQTDPTGPENPDNGEFRPIRGGSYFYSPKRCRNSRRRGYDPSYRVEDYGCRLALNLK